MADLLRRLPISYGKRQWALGGPLDRPRLTRIKAGWRSPDQDACANPAAATFSAGCSAAVNPRSLNSAKGVGHGNEKNGELGSDERSARGLEACAHGLGACGVLAQRAGRS